MHNILENPFYYGEMRTKRGIMPHVYKPIVSKELWDLCQKQKAIRAGQYLKTSEKNLLAFAFGLAAQIERDLISQRTKCSLASKKEQGIKLGRPIGAESKKLKLAKNLKRIQDLLAKGVSKNQISKIMNVQYMTLSRFIKRYGLN